MVAVSMPWSGATSTRLSTTHGARLAYLDGWRGCSLLLVFIGHATNSYIGGLGVEMFFVLSGRLMADVLIGERQPLGLFLWRRMARTWPALWAYVGLVSVGLGIAAILGDRRDVVTGAVAALTFTQNYVSAWVSVPYFDHSWSLAVEEQCYLLLALISVVLWRRRLPVAAVAVAMSVLAMANGWYQSLADGRHGWSIDIFYLYLRTDVRAGSILLPFALQIMARSARGRVALARLPWLAPVAFALWVWLLTGEENYLRFGPGTAVLAVTVVALDTSPLWWRRILSMPALVWVGMVSYSLYLWQQPFYMLHRAGVAGLMCIGGAIGCGLWSYYRIEQPARRYLAARTPAWVRVRADLAAT